MPETRAGEIERAVATAQFQAGLSHVLVFAVVALCIALILAVMWVDWDGKS